MTNWRAKISDLLLDQGTQKHEWGKTDCICQAMAAAKIKSHKDYMRGFRGKYSSYDGALKLVRKMGFQEPIDLVASKLEEYENVHDAGDGDIGVIKGIDGTLAFGIIMKDKVFIQTERGMGRVKRSGILRAFKVPEWPLHSLPSSSQDSAP